MSPKKTDKRAQKREFFTVTMQYSCSAVEDGKLNCATRSGLTTNLSSKGMAFYTYSSLEKGQGLTVYSGQIAESPLKAEVRWCTKLADSLYRVGVSFN